MTEALQYMWAVAKLMRPYWGRLSKTVAMGVGIGLFAMIPPLITKLLFDRVYPHRDIDLLQVLVVALFTLTITNAFLGAVKGYFSQTVSAELTRATGLMFFNHLQHLSVRFFDNHRVGEITSRFQDVRRSLETVSRVFETIVVSGVYLILVPPILLLLSPKLALLSFVAVPLTTTVSTLSARWVRVFTKEGMEVAADLSAFQIETLTHIRTLKTLAAEHFVYSVAAKHLQAGMRLQLRVAAIMVIVGLGNSVLRALSYGIFSWVAWLMIVQQEMTLGGFIAFTAYLGYLTGPVSQFGSLFVSFQQSAVSYGRMFEYLEEPVEQEPNLAYHPLPAIQHRFRGHISLRGISFGYTPAKSVLREVNCEIAPGLHTAIIGSSGAGKSSLLRLLARLEVPDEGVVLFDGVPANSIPLPDLRRQVGIVWQEFSMMRGTIWDNLTLGMDDVAVADVDEIVTICRLKSLVEELPDGYETGVGEWGATLSGGQRQRFAIARVLLRSTPIVLLDEATSNIDVHTEKEMLRDLTTHLTHRTLVYVTHRLAAACMADQILVMADGRLVGSGGHRDLLQSCEVYRGMWEEGGLMRSDDAPQLRVVGGPETRTPL